MTRYLRDGRGQTTHTGNLKYMSEEPTIFIEKAAKYFQENLTKLQSLLIGFVLHKNGGEKLYITGCSCMNESYTLCKC